MEPHGGRGGNNSNNSNCFNMFPSITNNNNSHPQQQQQQPPLPLNNESLEAFLAASQMGFSAGLTQLLLSGSLPQQQQQQQTAAPASNSGGFQLQPHPFHSLATTGTGAGTTFAAPAAPTTPNTWGSTTAMSLSSANLMEHNNQNNNNQNNNAASNNNCSSTSSMTSAAAPVAPLSNPAPWIPTLFGKRVNLPGMSSITSGVAAASAAAAASKTKTKQPPATTTSTTTSSNQSMSTATASKGRRRARRNSNESCSTSTSLGKRSASGGAAASALGAVSEDEEDHSKRRQDRNIREQLRSHQINDQITELRDLLVKADLRFKPDKFSTLATVAHYITALQSKQKALEEEHEQLIQTMTKTAQLMTQAMAPNPPQDDELQNWGGNSCGPSSLMNSSNTPSPPDTDLGIDYKTVFTVGGYSLFGTSINSIEGRFLDCNPGFEETSGFSRHELLPLSEQGHQGQVGEDGIGRNLSLFNVLARQDMERVFTSMSNMLRRPPPPEPDSSTVAAPFGDEDTWTTIVTLCRKPNQQVQLCLKLIRTEDKRPRLFNCTLIPQGTNGTCGALSITDGQPLSATG